MALADLSLIESRLLEIWKTVLANENVSSEDVFVNLGGDSISAMLCISRVRAAFGVELIIEDFFFEDATVKSLAKNIEKLALGRTTD